MDLHDAPVGPAGAIAVADPSVPRGWSWVVPAELAVQKRGQVFGFSDRPAAIEPGLANQLLTVDPNSPTGVSWLGQWLTFTIYCGAPGSQVMAMDEVGYLRLPVSVQRHELVVTLFKPSTEPLALRVRSGTVSENIVLDAQTVLHRHSQSLVIPNEGLIEIDVVQAAGDARGLSVLLVGRQWLIANPKG